MVEGTEEVLVDGISNLDSSTVIWIYYIVGLASVSLFAEREHKSTLTWNML